MNRTPKLYRGHTSNVTNGYEMYEWEEENIK